MSYKIDFPNSTSLNFGITSPEDNSYNCIAWACGIKNYKFWPDCEEYGYFWPKNITNKHDINSFIEFFKIYGFNTCFDGKYEHGFEKIAIYAKNEQVTHASRQINQRQWTSKIGDSHDVGHTLDALDGGMYGNIIEYMKRKNEDK